MRKAIIRDGKIVSFTNNTDARGISVVGIETAGLKTELDISKAFKLKEIKETFQGKINALTAKYNKYEVESFVDQRAEWKAWHLDDTSKTPMVDVIADARGIDREVLLGGIGKNVLFILGVQGEQNKLEDAIKACTTEEELEAINA